MKHVTALLLLALLSLTACSTDTGDTTASASSLAAGVDALPAGELSEQEIEDLRYMREEEKLARDVYRKLYTQWQQQVFSNIALSEQKHTDAVLLLIERYQMDDPAGANAEGEFTDTRLQALYDSLVQEGAASLGSALMVGAAIEEIDMIDIQAAIDHCEQNDDIVLVYQSLMDGSRKHLRAFVNNLNQQGIVYTPQYLSQSAYDSIIGSASQGATVSF